MSMEIELNQIDLTVLMDAFIALKEDQLEPHDSLDCIGWRTAQHLHDPYYLLHGDSTCENLKRLGLLVASENDVPVLYRITRRGEQIIDARLKETLSVPQVPKPKLDEAAREILRLSHRLEVETQRCQKMEAALNFILKTCLQTTEYNRTVAEIHDQVLTAFKEE